MARAADDIPDATLRLLVTAGIGAITHARLRRHFGSDEAAVAAGAGELARIRGLGPGSADALRRALDGADTELERRHMADCEAGLIVRGDGDYPALLEAIPERRTFSATSRRGFSCWAS